MNASNTSGPRMVFNHDFHSVACLPFKQRRIRVDGFTWVSKVGSVSSVSVLSLILMMIQTRQVSLLLMVMQTLLLRFAVPRHQPRSTLAEVGRAGALAAPVRQPVLQVQGPGLLVDNPGPGRGAEQEETSCGQAGDNGMICSRSHTGLISHS